MKDLLGEYKLVLGLEIHFHLKTQTKMFCGCDANFYGAEPNTHTCPTCLGLPGALPVPNEEAIKMAQLFGLAVGCTLATSSKFDRKHYFYPDLPKGYQISQYKEPFCENGELTLSSGNTIHIERVHLEEDTAKSIHQKGKSLIDFNKSGMPLVELVTDPDFRTVEDAVEFSKKIKDIIKFLDISDADMEKGQLRLEANISLRTAEMELNNNYPDYKVEIKNINSFKFMEKAVNAEIVRQKAMLEAGEQPIQENRGYDEAKGVTVAQRTKEDAHDYRYFPEPDIPPMEFDEHYFEELKSQLPVLPDEKLNQLMEQYELSEQAATELTKGTNIDLLTQLEELIDYDVNAKKAANLILNRPEVRNLSVQDFIEFMKETEETVDDTSKLEELVKEAISENQQAVEDFKKGKDSAVKFLLGQVMRKSQGKANPQIVEDIILKHLNQ